MTRTKIATAFAVAALASAAAVPAASAGGSPPGNQNGFFADEATVDLFYGFDSGYALFVGFTAEDACFGTPPPTVPARVFARADGTFTVMSHGRPEVDMYLYEFNDPPILIDETCAALFDDDPSTQPLQPIATGTGQVKFAITGIEGPDDMGGFHIVNSANGTVTAEDGTQWKVRGHADFDLGEDGVPIGSPADFQGLRVNQIKRGQ